MIEIQVGRVARCTVSGVLALGLVLSPLALGASAAETKPKRRPSFQAPSFNPTDPILKCTADDRSGAQTYAIVQTSTETLSDTALAWGIGYPDHPACGRVSADEAVGFLKSITASPNWIAAHWQPTPEVIQAAKGRILEAQRKDAADQAVAQAVAAAAKRDYTAALAMARKAAELGHPMDKDQVDYFTQKSAQQEQAAAEAAKTEAARQAATATAAQIMDRQQKDYAERERKAKARAAANEPNEAVAAMQGQVMGSYSKSVGAATAQNTAHVGGPTQANAVGNGVATNTTIPATYQTYPVATACITLDGSGMAAKNSCGYTVTVLWCVRGAKSCGHDGGLPEGREEVAANGQAPIADGQAPAAQVRIWACQSPGVPRAKTDTGFECR